MTKPGKTLKSDELAHPSSFCWNENCVDYGRVDAVNIHKFGFTRKGRQRWQCTTCKKVFAETKGTVFHGKKHDEQTIIECFAMLGDRNSLAAIHRIKGIDEPRTTRRSVDLRWPQGRKKGLPEEERRGTFWRGTAIDTDTRLRVGRAIAKTEEEVAPELKKQIKELGHQEAPPAIATDGKGAYREAMVETWGKVPEPKPSGKGLPPEKKQPQPGWHYLQVVKCREGGRVVEVKVEVVYGDETTLDLVGAQTSYVEHVERTNLTSRHMNGRLVRKRRAVRSNRVRCHRSTRSTQIRSRRT